MTAPSTIDLPPDLYDRVHRMARHRHQPVPELIADALDLTEENDTGNAHIESINWAEPDEAVEREQTAYRALHSHLWATYPNQYVAIFDGVLIDHDSDGAALSERIEQRYSDQFVLIRRVEQSTVQREIAALSTLTTEELHQVAGSEMSSEDQAALEQLLYWQNMRSLTQRELAKLEKLRAEYGRVLVRKARAFALLAERGQPMPF